MKLELTPTDLDMLTTKYPRSKVSIEYPADDLTMEEMCQELIIPALLAYGFSYETFKDYFPD